MNLCALTTVRDAKRTSNNTILWTAYISIPGTLEMIRESSEERNRRNGTDPDNPNGDERAAFRFFSWIITEIREENLEGNRTSGRSLEASQILIRVGGAS